MAERDAEEVRALAALARIARGDESALDDLYRTYAPTVLAFVLVRAPSREVAEEIAADTWLGCWRSARAFRGDSRVLTWILGIAKRQTYTRMRRKRVPECPLDYSAEIVDDAGDPADAVIAEAGVEELLSALEALPPELSETVRLAWLHDLTYPDIANITDVPVGTVKSRVFRARRMLQETLGRRV